MQAVRLLFVIVFVAAACSDQRSVAAAPGSLLGHVDNVSLPTTGEQSVDLLATDDANFIVICFLGTECPLARVYGPRLNKLAETYRSRGVRFVGVNSNIQDSMDDLREYVTQHEINFPVAKDYDRKVAVQAGATRTPEVIVVDQTGNIKYRGRIDDQYQPGVARKEASRHDLRDALDQLVTGKPVQTPQTEPVGCLISLPRKTSVTPEPSDVTYCDQIAPVLQKHCIECHRPGEIGPFVLDDYDEVVGWADMMVEVIDQKRMPPWHADPNHGSFANTRHMPDADKELIRSWVQAGTPFGDPNNLPDKPTYTSGWRLPSNPDVVFQMNKDGFAVPADGVVEYQYYVVDPKFTEDKWIKAAQVIPGNASVVHHCIAFIRPPDAGSFDDFGMLAAYVPGQLSTTLPDGYARRVAAGSRIVFQMHYTPTGTPQHDNTKIGIIFEDPDSVTHEVFAIAGIDQEFEIPPNQAEYRVSANVGWFPRNGYLLSITPHMHLRGRSFELTGHQSDKEETLLRVPFYDFNWQHSYELTEPLPLKDLEEIQFTATFDNSAGNPTNPDPNEYVTWGDQTWQEMAVVFLSVARPIGGGKTRPARQRRWQANKEQLARADAFARKYIERFDKNDDGHLTYRELPTSVRMFSWFDHNHDQVISHDEIRNESLSRIHSSR